MTSKELLEGLMGNYAESLHPSPVHQTDFIRTIRNFGFSDGQLDLLYEELLKSCEYFPKVYDLHQAANKLGLESADQTPVAKTRRMLDQYQGHTQDGMTFQEWLKDGGLDFIRKDCGYDEAKIKRRLAVMGVTSTPDVPKKEEHESNFRFLSDDLPKYDFPLLTDGKSSIDDL